VAKHKGSTVYAATANQGGALICRATRLGPDSTPPLFSTSVESKSFEGCTYAHLILLLICKFTIREWRYKTVKRYIICNIYFVTYENGR